MHLQPAKDRTFLIAEAGVNHNGDMDLARQLIDVAAEAGADAVKFQTFRAERILCRNAPKAGYQLETTASGESQFDMIRRLELSKVQHIELMAYCKDRKITFISTPFDKESADLLDKLGVPLFKVPSGEVTNLPFLKEVAHRGKPIILSTGMAYLNEVERAVKTILEAGCTDLTLLHCTTDYPATFGSVNLNAMATMKQAFRLPVGYSDHTPGIEVAVAAVSMGASVIEKHFTLDRTLPGPDHRASLEPEELKALVRAIRNVEAALGDGIKRPTDREQEMRRIVRKSLVTARDMPVGSIIQHEDLAVKRPGTGLPPDRLDWAVGHRLRKAVAADTPLTEDML